MLFPANRHLAVLIHNVVKQINRQFVLVYPTSLALRLTADPSALVTQIARLNSLALT